MRERIESEPDSREEILFNALFTLLPNIVGPFDRSQVLTTIINNLGLDDRQILELLDDRQLFRQRIREAETYLSR